MPSATRLGNRLVSRSATDASAPSVSVSAPSSTSVSAPITSSAQSSASSRLQPRQSLQQQQQQHNYPPPQHQPDKSLSNFHNSSRGSLPLSVILHRYWKKLNEKDATGKRSRIAQAFAAFKMGLYFKIFITLILVLRFASHSSQRAYPASSVLPDHHFGALSAAHVSPALRIIVLTQPGYSNTLSPLLKSLADADYQHDSAHLDVWMFASSFCNYVPLPLYPLAMAIFGPPRFDHAVPPIFDALQWPHGKKALIAIRTEPDWSSVWQSSRGTANESLVFVDASLAQSVSPSFYVWLKRVRAATSRGMIANAPVISFDSIAIPDGVPPTDTAVLLEQFFPATAVFSPTQDVWVTFQKWFALHTRSWFAQPRLPRELLLGGYSFVDSLRMHLVRAWFAQFLSQYGERVIFPVLHANQTLVVRRPGTTAGAIAGTGMLRRVHISRWAELETSRLDAALGDIAIPEQPVLVKANGSVTTADAPYGSPSGKRAGRGRRAMIGDIVSPDAARKYRDVLRGIGDFARSRGSESIAFTMVTAAFVETTVSWLCNVATLDMVPVAMVLAASEDKVARQLEVFLSQHPRLQQGSLVVSMHGTVAATDKDPEAPLHFGTSAYWMLMLQRTFLLRDLLERGLSILQFETDQVWLSDPMPHVRHEIRQREAGDGGVEDYRLPDMVVTMNTLNEVAGNFFYVRPTVGTRHLLAMVVDRFLRSYRASRTSRAARKNRFHYIANDQSILTTLVTGRDWVYAREFPKVKVSVLNRELFVDGQWFADFEDEKGRRAKRRKHYTSESSLYPVVVNNNFVIGVTAKMQRAKRFGFWFVKNGGKSKGWQCDEMTVQRAARAGSVKEHRDAPVVELGGTGVNRLV